MEIQQQQQQNSLSSHSPSFNSYSSQNLADIAARVVSELNLNHDDPYDDDFYSSLQNDAVQLPPLNDAVEEEDEEDDDSEFEFVVLCKEQNMSPISADEIFQDGQIKPMFPIFNTDLVYGTALPQNDTPQRTIRLPLRKLMSGERESCSSSEADDLEGVPEGTYCVWTPQKNKSQDDDVVMRKKSKSTGSNSKRWRIRDLLHRSNSDGKDTFVFLTPSHNNNNHHHQNQNGVVESNKRRENQKLKKLEGRKKSYLPYRQDLVGFFANVNGISRTVRPF